MIALAPDTITYWRNPGEAGVPPVFDFSGSENVKATAVGMPAPARIREAGGDVFGYSGRVAYAVTITPADPAKPVRVALKMDYAACEKICIPMHAEGRLELAPGAAAGADKPAVDDAFAALPRPATLAEAGGLAPVAGADKPSWRFTPAAPGATDLFAEAPDGYFFETARDGADAFRLVLAERPKAGASQPLPVRLTLAGASGAAEFQVRLDGSSLKP